VRQEVATLGSWMINPPKKTGPSPKQNAVVRLESGSRGEIIDQWFRSRAIPQRAPTGVFNVSPSNLFCTPLALNTVECLDKSASRT
jgi:hypothetical protein